MSCVDEEKEDTISLPVVKILPHLIVGAGNGGIDTAVAFQEQGIPFVVFERNAGPGGVWNLEENGAANNQSQIQSDPLMYSPPGWFLDHKIEVDDKFRGIHQSVSDVRRMQQEIIEKHNISVQHNRIVLNCW